MLLVNWSVSCPCHVAFTGLYLLLVMLTDHALSIREGKDVKMRRKVI